MPDPIELEDGSGDLELEDGTGTIDMEQDLPSTTDILVPPRTLGGGSW